jgi:hypothetical protein
VRAEYGFPASTNNQSVGRVCEPSRLRFSAPGTTTGMPRAGQPLPQLAREYHVDAQTMRHTVEGTTWKHLPLTRASTGIHRASGLRDHRMATDVITGSARLSTRTVVRLSDGGHEKLPGDGQIAARWRP